MTNLSKSASTVLLERVLKQDKEKAWDVFLSHAFLDREMLSGTVLVIEDLGYTVYVDWREDPMLDRTQVTPTTATVLRDRMRASKCLFYSVTPNEKESAWMKWELGWKDGHNSRTAILPIVTETTEVSNEQQFLGIYPYVSDGTVKDSKRRTLWIHKSPNCYVNFEDWLKGNEPKNHV